MLPVHDDDRRLKKPLIVDTRFIGLIPEQLQGSACFGCDKLQAKWAIREPKFDEQGQIVGINEAAPVCSLCFLYESGWGERNKNAIADIITDVEKKAGKFLRTASGRLLSSTDSDNVLHAIVFISKLYEFRKTQIATAAGQQPPVAEEEEPVDEKNE